MVKLVSLELEVVFVELALADEEVEEEAELPEEELKEAKILL